MGKPLRGEVRRSVRTVRDHVGRVPKKPAGVAGAAGGGSLLVGGGIVGALLAAAAVGGIWWLERARKTREELTR